MPSMGVGCAVVSRALPALPPHSHVWHRPEVKLLSKVTQTLHTYAFGRRRPGDGLPFGREGQLHPAASAGTSPPALAFKVREAAAPRSATAGLRRRTLRRWLEQQGIPFEILSEDTYRSVGRTPPAGPRAYVQPIAPWHPHTAAQRLALRASRWGITAKTPETFLPNLVYSGRLQAMPALHH